MDSERVEAIEVQLIEARRAVGEARRAAVDAGLVLTQREAAVEALERELAVASAAPRSLAGLARTDAVEVLLRQADRLIGPKALAELLEQNGWPPQNPDAVTATLGHLVKRGRARREGHGRYGPATP